MTITLYHLAASPPVRAVKLTLKALDIKYEEVEVNMMAGDHLKPEFLKLNPLHTVPVLVDNGYAVYDSHAIMIYLMETYGGKNNSLYPQDIKQRTAVHQRLFFEAGTLFTRLRPIVTALRLQKEIIPSEDKIEAVKEVYKMMEDMLKGNLWLAGNNITIADFSCITSITTLSKGLLPDIPLPTKVQQWVERCENSIKGYEDINHKGLLQFIEYVEHLRKQ